MKNANFGQRIKELRISLGLSQDQLAEQTQLSLRTIQRIENGETDARGDTITRLAKALCISTQDIYGWREQEDNSYIVIFNLSALSFIVFPLLGVLVPLVLWLYKRDKIKYLNETGKKMLNFQISWCLLVLSAYAWMSISAIFGLKQWYLSGYAIPTLIVVIYVLYAINILFIIINTIRSIKAKSVIYQPSIPFLR